MNNKIRCNLLHSAWLTFFLLKLMLLPNQSEKCLSDSDKETVSISCLDVGRNIKASHDWEYLSKKELKITRPPQTTNLLLIWSWVFSINGNSGQAEVKVWFVIRRFFFERNFFFLFLNISFAANCSDIDHPCWTKKDQSFHFCWKVSEIDFYRLNSHSGFPRTLSRFFFWTIQSYNRLGCFGYLTKHTFFIVFCVDLKNMQI